MKICKIEELTGKEVLARDVTTLDYQILLSEGTLLKPEYIQKLIDYNIKEVFVLDGQLDVHTIGILREEVEESVKSKVRSVLEKHTYSHNEELKELSETADYIISNILQEDQIIEKIYDIRERSSDIYEHSVNLCSMAILVALKMGIKQDSIHDLGISCLLHDLGLRYLTVPYENQNLEQLSPTELNEYKMHPVYGYSSLRNEKWISTASKNMILYHHERLDGEGYPLHAREISLECRIIQVCDAFDEMICGIGCERVKVYEAIEYLKVYKGVKFDAKVVDVFLEFTAVYPAGTRIVTNEGEVGIVMYQNRQFPDRPVIKIFKDSSGQKVSVIKDLLKINTVFIERTLD